MRTLKRKFADAVAHAGARVEQARLNLEVAEMELAAVKKWALAHAAAAASDACKPGIILSQGGGVPVPEPGQAREFVAFGKSFAAILKFLLEAARTALDPVPGLVWDWLVERVVVSLTIDHDDGAYSHIQSWIKDQPKAKKARNLV